MQREFALDKMNCSPDNQLAIGKSHSIQRRGKPWAI